MKKGGGGKKGSAFERDFAVRLSTWWTQDLNEPRSDIFWRSTTSGARATVRLKGGKRTAGSYGDITAIDPIGIPFLKAFSVECKKGYSRHSIQDMIDADKSKYGEWIAKLRKTAAAAGSLWWMLVVKRDRREPLMLVPGDCWFPESPMVSMSRDGNSIKDWIDVYSLQQLWESDPKWVLNAIEKEQANGKAQKEASEPEGLGSKETALR